MRIPTVNVLEKALIQVDVVWKLTHLCARLLIDEREHHVLFSLIETFVDEGSNQSSDGRLVKWDEIKYSYWIAKGQKKNRTKTLNFPTCPFSRSLLSFCFPKWYGIISYIDFAHSQEKYTSVRSISICSGEWRITSHFSCGISFENWKDGWKVHWIRWDIEKMRKNILHEFELSSLIWLWNVLNKEICFCCWRRPASGAKQQQERR